MRVRFRLRRGSGHLVPVGKRTHQQDPAWRVARESLTASRWPVKIRDSSWGDVPNAMFIVSHQRSEEKGTDVNVASRLLLDVLGKQVDAAIVISNDSDLRLPIQESRLRVPVGTVNPGRGRLAGDLAGRRDDGVGMHWWYKLDSDDYTGCQLPDPAKQFAKPADW